MIRVKRPARPIPQGLLTDACKRQIAEATRLFSVKENWGTSTSLTGYNDQTVKDRLEELTTNLPDFEDDDAFKTNRYYYLPPGSSLRLSKRPARPGQSEAERTPEFLFVKYTTEERAEAGGVQGGIPLHAQSNL